MNLLLHYARKLLLVLKNEVLVLPSRTVVALFFIFLLSMPLVADDPYIMRVLIQASIFAILAASWDLLSGFTGQVNFGHALFFGVGAYAAAMINIRFGTPAWIDIPLGAIAAVLAGLTVGVPCLRLKGTYLALTTLAFPIILLGIVFAFPDVTGGELGISGISRLSYSRTATYYIIVVTMLVVVTIMWKITDSNTGLLFHAIREDELAAKASGINTVMYKLVAFSLSGFFAGIAGGLYAHFMRIVGPSTLEINLSFQVVIWCVFGGMVTIWGPVGAVFVLFPLLEVFRMWPQVRQLLFAVVVMIILLYMPEGLLPWLRDKIETECPRCKVRNLSTRQTCRVCAADIH